MLEFDLGKYVRTLSHTKVQNGLRVLTVNMFELCFASFCMFGCLHDFFISHLAEQNLHVYIFKENMELLLLDLLIFPPQTLATFRHKTYICSCISGSKVHKHREITKTNTTTFSFARPHTLITFHCFLFLARSDIFYKPHNRVIVFLNMETNSAWQKAQCRQRDRRWLI